MTSALLIALTGVSIYALRASFVVAAGRIELPDTIRRALGFGPPAVLAALLASLVVADSPRSPDPRALAVTVVALAVSRRASMVPTIGAGFVTLVLIGSL